MSRTIRKLSATTFGRFCGVRLYNTCTSREIRTCDVWTFKKFFTASKKDPHDDRCAAAGNRKIYREKLEVPLWTFSARMYIRSSPELACFGTKMVIIITWKELIRSSTVSLRPFNLAVYHVWLCCGLCIVQLCASSIGSNSYGKELESQLPLPCASSQNGLKK
ncbi:MAG: hypothetical protein ACLT76_06475 [Clostridium fessum]